VRKYYEKIISGMIAWFTKLITYFNSFCVERAYPHKTKIFILTVREIIIIILKEEKEKEKCNN